MPRNLYEICKVLVAYLSRILGIPLPSIDIMKLPAQIPTLLLTLCAWGSLLASPSAAPIERGPYLQLATENSIRIVWRTQKKITPVVRYGFKAHDLNMTSSGSSILLRQTQKAHQSHFTKPLSQAPRGTHQYEATVSQLQPDTLYHYAVYDGDQRLTSANQRFTFRTHPRPGTKRDAYIWVVGDSGTGEQAQKQVHQAMLRYNQKNKLTLDMFLHVGDMAYGSGTDPEFQKKYFKVYQQTLQNTVCWPAMGNHEGKTSQGKTGTGPYYDAYITPTKAEAGGVASGNESYYSFDYGRIHFIVLNSHDLDRRPTATMAQWLREDLAKTSPKKTDWLIAYWHHPPYTKGSHDSDTEHQLIEMREHIMPILESNGVDLVLSGHSHIYERSMLMDGAYETPTIAENKILDDGDGDQKGDGAYQKSPGLKPNQGTVQIVTGHGGKGMKRKGYSPVMRRSILQYGSTLIQVKGSELIVSMLNKDGKIADTFQIHKKKPIQPKRIAQPWQPGVIKAGKPIIPQNALWKYHTMSHPADHWTAPDFSTSEWKQGRAGFGYGDEDDSTPLAIKNQFPSVYIRRDFTLDNVGDAQDLWLSISYDDAFILYINGQEALRKGVGKGRGAKARRIVSHEAQGKFELFHLAPSAQLFRKGRNVIAVEGHNIKKNSSDFTLHPSLLLKTR